MQIERDYIHSRLRRSNVEDVKSDFYHEGILYGSLRDIYAHEIKPYKSILSKSRSTETPAQTLNSSPKALDSAISKVDELEEIVDTDW